MTLPFRTALAHTSGSVSLADVGAVAERVEDVIRAAGGATEADARLRGWINHGDERVPLALIAGSLAPWLARHESWSLHLYARAIRDAERDRVCWTPLLDHLAAAGIWPTQKGRVVLGGKVTVVHPLPVSQVIEPLRLWLREQTDGIALAPLAAFHATPVRALLQSRLAVLPAVASYTGEYPSQRVETVPAELRVTKVPVDGAKPIGAPAISPSIVTSHAPANAPANAPTIAPTGALPNSASAAVASAPPEALPAMASGGLAAPPAASGVARSAPAAATPAVSFGLHGVADQPAAPVWVAASPSITATTVTERRYTNEQVSGLLSIANQATGRTEESQVRPEIRRAVNALIEYRALPSEKLYTLYSACRLVKTWVVRIVAHVSATIELWRAALRDNNWLEVREAIVKSATARRDSVIRLILSRCGSSEVLCALCLDGDMPDVPQIARRLRAANPRGLLEALQVAARTTGLRLAASDLVPLVQHDDPEVRQQAVSLLQLMVRPG